MNVYNISLNKNNIKLIYFKCHSIIHERFGYKKSKKVYIVYGSPYSGKSVWVNNNITKDDLVIDINKIWECISSCDKYNKPNRLKQNVFEIHNALINQVKLRTDKRKTTFIISGYPLLMNRIRITS